MTTRSGSTRLVLAQYPESPRRSRPSDNSCWGTRCSCNCSFRRDRTSLSPPAPRRLDGADARQSTPSHLRPSLLSAGRQLVQRLVLDRALPRCLLIGAERLGHCRPAVQRWRVLGRAVGSALARMRSSGDRTSRLRREAFSVLLLGEAHWIVQISGGLRAARVRAGGGASCTGSRYTALSWS